MQKTGHRLCFGKPWRSKNTLSICKSLRESSMVHMDSQEGPLSKAHMDVQGRTAISGARGCPGEDLYQGCTWTSRGGLLSGVHVAVQGRTTIIGAHGCLGEDCYDVQGRTAMNGAHICPGKDNYQKCTWTSRGEPLTKVHMDIQGRTTIKGTHGRPGENCYQ